jgi:hypothetical protein
MFPTAIVASSADVALPIPRLIRMEMVKRLGATFRQRAVVAIMGIVAVVDVSVEAVWAVKPWTGADKDSAHKPVRPIVAVGSTIIRGVVKIPVRTYRRYSNANRNLRRGHGRRVTE